VPVAVALSLAIPLFLRDIFWELFGVLAPDDGVLDDVTLRIKIGRAHV
jgi:hypothetical protein